VGVAHVEGTRDLLSYTVVIRGRNAGNEETEMSTWQQLARELLNAANK
jgi:hypothetical protein